MNFPSLRVAIFLCLTLTTEANADILEQGRAVYNFRCYFCHGYSGNAKTLAATYLSPPPVDFTRADPNRLDQALVIETLRTGRPGTAMKSFFKVLPPSEIEAVAAFVVDEFVRRKAINTRYHTTENGWPDHERYRIAFPFALGEISLSLPWEELDEQQVRGKRLYLSSCVSCHDRGRPEPEAVEWNARPLSYPRNHFSLATAHKLDAISSASPYAKHDIPPKFSRLTRVERRGERLFQQNCAFCHGADGTGMNWIGRFMEPHPRNLRDPDFMVTTSKQKLTAVISEGLPNTSMPAWKSVLNIGEIGAIVSYIHRAFHPLAEQ